MESFLCLSKDRQQQIISAGLFCFGKMGYKKTSVSDLAQKAGISKAMVFHYFGNKKSYYVFLLETVCDFLEDIINKNVDKKCRDFFERIVEDMKCRQIAVNVYPSIYQFMASVLHEDNPEIIEEIRKIRKRGESFHLEIALKDIDIYKFKETVKPEMVFELITAYLENITKESIEMEETDNEKLFNRFYECIEMLRVNFYKPEYLKEDK